MEQLGDAPREKSRLPLHHPDHLFAFISSSSTGVVVVVGVIALCTGEKVDTKAREVGTNGALGLTVIYGDR